MKRFKPAVKGFTLIEMLLVMAIIAAIMLGFATYSQQRTLQLKEDRAVLQVQQILNAGMAYYLNNSSWPTSLEKDLQGDGTTDHPGGYLPGPSSAVTIVSPWAKDYVIGTSNPTAASNAANALFAVCTTIIAGDATATVAKILAGRLPMAYMVDGDHSADCASTGIPSATACTSDSKSCTLVAVVNIPGQNLNNARAINFAGVYNHGGCVAAPTCPYQMKSQIFIAPTSVSGMYDGDTTKVYPINSFTVYLAPGDGTAVEPKAQPPACSTTDTYTPTCPVGGTYWRVCAQIITQRGLVNYTSDAGSKGAVKILAITRCMPSGEDKEGTVSGSDISKASY